MSSSCTVFFGTNDLGSFFGLGTRFKEKVFGPVCFTSSTSIGSALISSFSILPSDKYFSIVCCDNFASFVTPVPLSVNSAMISVGNLAFTLYCLTPPGVVIFNVSPSDKVSENVLNAFPVKSGCWFESTSSFSFTSKLSIQEITSFQTSLVS